MIKFRWSYDVDKDEEFLNKMSSHGYAMTKFFLGFYTFERCKENEYTYRCELISDKSKKGREEFYELALSLGAELVTTWGVWAIFRKKGPFQLYTDKESRIIYYKRIRRIFILMVCSMFFMMLSQFALYISGAKRTALIFLCVFGFFVLIFATQVYSYSKKIKKLKNDIA